MRLARQSSKECQFEMIVGGEFDHFVFEWTKLLLPSKNSKAFTLICTHSFLLSITCEESAFPNVYLCLPSIENVQCTRTALFSISCATVKSTKSWLPTWNKTIVKPFSTDNEALHRSFFISVTDWCHLHEFSCVLLFSERVQIQWYESNCQRLRVHFDDSYK